LGKISNGGGCEGEKNNKFPKIIVEFLYKGICIKRSSNAPKQRLNDQFKTLNE